MLISLPNGTQHWVSDREPVLGNLKRAAKSMDIAIPVWAWRDDEPTQHSTPAASYMSQAEQLNAIAKALAKIAAPMSDTSNSSDE